MDDPLHTYQERSASRARAVLAPGMLVRIQDHLDGSLASILIRLDECRPESVRYTYWYEPENDMASTSRGWDLFNRHWCLASPEDEAGWILHTLEGA
jgi:hypothetical protein